MPKNNKGQKFAGKAPALKIRATNDKVVRAPAARSVTRRNGVPKVQYYPDGTCTVEHREFVQDILTDTANVFAYDTFTLNPSDSLTFPWLAPFATRFESYRFEKLECETLSLVGSEASGRTMLAIDYDSRDSTSFATKTELMNFYRSESAAMWGSCKHVSTREDLTRIGPWRFVNEDALLDDVTDRLNSTGNLFVATTSTNADSDAGGLAVAELYISYCIRFRTAVLHSVSGVAGNIVQDTNTTTVTGVTVVGNLPTSSITDVLANAKIFFDLAGRNTSSVVVDTAIGTGVPSGYKGSVPNLYNFVASGLPVPDSQTLMKFVRDYAGQIHIGTSGTNSTVTTVLGPTNISLSAAAPVRLENAKVIAPQQSLALLQASGTGNIFTNDQVWDVVAAAGAAFAATNAAFRYLPSPAVGAVATAARFLRFVRSNFVHTDLNDRKYTHVTAGRYSLVYADRRGTMSEAEAISSHNAFVSTW